MNALVNHLIKTNWDEIKSKSLLHCHARNVHSIMLLCSPGKTIRLFFAEPNHDLYKNLPINFSKGVSVGFHAHHCEITLYPVLGRICNWKISLTKPASCTELFLFGYRYKSAIGGGTPSFQWNKKMYWFNSYPVQWIEKHPHYMTAKEIHTVGVAQGEPAAWLVFEGREDKDYCPITYANSDLDKFDWSGLYKKPSERRLRSILKRCGYDV